MSTCTQKDRTGIILPIFDCMPCGAQYACLGLKDSISIVHGAQGCCTFVRLLFAQHFKENFNIATSSLHEDAAVFGGLQRVIDGVQNLAVRYPEIRIIPIITTCSTEVIGDDIESAITTVNRFLAEHMPERELKVVGIHTPSFQNSQVGGYDIAIESLVKQIAVKTEPSGKVNLLTGWVNPGDVKELKYIFNEFEVPVNVMVDTTEFGTAITPKAEDFVECYKFGSTTLEDIQDTANADATVACYKYEGGKAANYLKKAFEIPAYTDIIPIGIEGTDKFVKQLSKISGKKIPASLIEERGKALNSIVDLGHMWFAGKKVAIYGDPDMVIGLANYCIELGMQPVLVLFGDNFAPYKRDPRVKELMAKADENDFEMQVVTNADLWVLDKAIKDGLELDLILGHSKGRFVSFENHVPLVRVGFPTFDRAGLWKHPIMGYKGAELLAETMANAIFTDMEYKEDKEWKINVW